VTSLKPWAQGPFELLLHAEEHYLNGSDHDRRIALIGFDESIEVSISVYLSLDPIQRNGKVYEQAEVRTWTKNYHTKLDFFYSELERRGVEPVVPKDHVIWFHKHRNEQYHGGIKGIPDKDTVDGIRETAFWVFATLFDIPDINTLIQAELRKKSGFVGDRDEKIDKALDSTFGLIEIGKNLYYTSEILFAVDPNAYFEWGNEIINENEKVGIDENLD